MSHWSLKSDLTTGGLRSPKRLQFLKNFPIGNWPKLLQNWYFLGFFPLISEKEKIMNTGKKGILGEWDEADEKICILSQILVKNSI